MLAEVTNENHNTRSSSAMTPDFERRHAAPDAGHAKARRSASAPAFGPGVQRVIRKFEKQNRKVSPYTPREHVVVAHAVSGPNVKPPSTPPRRVGNRRGSPRIATTQHGASSLTAAGPIAVSGRSPGPRPSRQRTPNQQSPDIGAGTGLYQSSPYSLGAREPSTILYDENCSVVSGRSSVQRARIQIELDQEEQNIAVLKAEARRLELRKKLNDHDARSSARSRTSRNSVADQLALTTADPTLARAPELVAHARGGNVLDTVSIDPTCARSLTAAGAGGRHMNDTEMYPPQAPIVHNVYNQSYVGTVGIDPVAASHAAVNVGLAMQSVAAQAAETTRAEVQREAEARHEASQQALTATALAAHQQVVADLSEQRDKSVEAARADASQQMAQRERVIVDLARDAVAQVEGGRRMAEVTAQATIGELQQARKALLQELEDQQMANQRQQTILGRDLEAARRYVTQVQYEKGEVEANAHVRLSAVTSEVAKWQATAERYKGALQAGAGPSTEFQIHSPNKDEPHPTAQKSTRYSRGSSPTAAASRQDEKRSSPIGASGKRCSLTAASKGKVPPSNPHLDAANKRIAALEKRLEDKDKIYRTQHRLKAQRQEKTTGNTDGARKTDKPSRRSAAPPLPWYEDSAPAVRNNVAASVKPLKTQYEQSGFLSTAVGPGTGRRGPYDSFPQAASTSDRSKSVPPERRGRGDPPPEDDDPGGEDGDEWDEEDWNEEEEEEEEYNSDQEDDEEGEGQPRTAQRSRPPPGGGALRAMTQLTEVTAPIRPTTPTIPELNLMAEVQETESANHRQLVSRIRGTSRNLTSLSSLHSPRHNCGALGV